LGYCLHGESALSSLNAFALVLMTGFFNAASVFYE